PDDYSSEPLGLSGPERPAQATVGREHRSRTEGSAADCRGDNEKSEARISQPGSNGVGEFPAVAEKRPVGSAQTVNAAKGIKGKETAGDLFRVKIPEPEIVDRMGNQPVDHVHQ